MLRRASLPLLNPWHWVATQTPVEWIVPVEYLQQLNNAAHYFFRGDTLHIDQKIDSGTMRFVRGPAASE